jgi:fused signal recognition particle receptor
MSKQRFFLIRWFVTLWQRLFGKPEAIEDASKPEKDQAAVSDAQTAEPVVDAPPPIAVEPEPELSFLQRLSRGVSKSRSWLTDGLMGTAIDDDFIEELETRLLTADMGMEVTTQVTDKLTQKLNRQQLQDEKVLWATVKEELVGILKNSNKPLEIKDCEHDGKKTPFVILMVGINGAGKTTTIGKLAHRFKAEGKSVMLAAGDTFRAAAVEQLKTWGERNDVSVVAQATGSDSAAVIYDALASAQAKGVDVLIADTAGRLHTAGNLMDELAKIRRVIGKFDPSAPHEVMLVVDGVTGQNALNQAIEFQKTAGVTGVTVTKLDGTAKGGVVIAIAKRLGLPIRFIGVGEQKADLGVFNATEFVDALLGLDSEQ